jgi:protein-tyrosine phosphatase
LDEPDRDPPPRIDWIAPADIADGRPGRIGMTVLPGKHGPSLRYPGHVYRGNLNEDLDALTAAGAALLVLLVEDAELSRWGDAAIVERGAARGVRIERFPFADGGTPDDAAEMDRILDTVDVARDTGDVAVACMGGVGRTGTVAACALVAAGWDADAAMRRVRELRHPTAVETDAQERFVRTYHRRHLARSSRVET